MRLIILYIYDICISKFVNKTRTGKLPSFAGRSVGFVNNDGAEAMGSLCARLNFYNNIFLIIMVKFQEKVC